jgi:hypothetical protein
VPHQISIHESDGTIVVTYHGDVFAREVIEVLDEILAQADCVQNHKLIADFALANGCVEASDIPDLAIATRKFEASISNAQWAIVTGTLRDFGVARMYESIVNADKIAMRTFHTVDEARTWLSPGVTASA